MPRYYFHFMWPDDCVRDTKGVELEGFSAAHRHAYGLVQQVRAYFPDADEHWWIEISDGIDGKSTAMLPAMVPGRRLRRLSGPLRK